MRALHGTHSVWKVFILQMRTHMALNREQARRTQDMNAGNALSRWVSLATLGVFAALLFLLAFAPQPSLYAG
jgi:hypothetical protein